jgi:hypothetical protein
MSSQIIARVTKPAIAAAVAAACLGTVAVPCFQATAHSAARATVVAGTPAPTISPDNSQWT